MSETLDAGTREWLRVEINRKRREQIGRHYAVQDDWIGFADASRILGVRASELPKRARERGLKIKKRLIQVADLDRLR